MSIVETQVWAGDDHNRINEARACWLDTMREDPERAVVRVDAARCTNRSERAYLIDEHVERVRSDIFGMAGSQAICLVDPEFQPEVVFTSSPARPWPVEFVAEFFRGLDGLPIDVYLGIACYRAVSDSLESLLQRGRNVTTSEFWVDQAVTPRLVDVIEGVFAARADTQIGAIQNDVPWLAVVRRLRAYIILASHGHDAVVRGRFIRRGEPVERWAEQAWARQPLVWQRALVVAAQGYDWQQLCEGRDAVTDQLTIDRLRLSALASAISEDL